jgi:hypothetical protein
MLPGDLFPFESESKFMFFYISKFMIIFELFSAIFFIYIKVYVIMYECIIETCNVCISMPDNYFEKEP